MAPYTGRTAKYTRSKGFDAATLAAIKDVKAQFQRPVWTYQPVSLPPLLPAPPCAGLLPPPGRTSSPYANECDRLMINGQTFAIGKAYVTADLEDAFAAAKRKAAAHQKFLAFMVSIKDMVDQTVRRQCNETIMPLLLEADYERWAWADEQLKLYRHMDERWLAWHRAHEGRAA